MNEYTVYYLNQEGLFSTALIYGETITEALTEFETGTYFNEIISISKN